jgi:hypothetical protein
VPARPPIRTAGVWDRIFAVNVKGVWQCCKGAAGDARAAERLLFRTRDEQLIEHWAQLDNLGILRQLGALPG